GGRVQGCALPIWVARAFGAERGDAFIRAQCGWRRIVRHAAAELADDRRAGLDIARMGYALEGMGRHVLATEAGRAADPAFHNTTLEAARNGALMALSSSI
ncbi:GntR family transcriptional regulator, partial [Methylobacterium radiotolerans]